MPRERQNETELQGTEKRINATDQSTKLAFQQTSQEETTEKEVEQKKGTGVARVALTEKQVSQTIRFDESIKEKLMALSIVTKTSMNAIVNLLVENECNRPDLKDKIDTVIEFNKKI